MARIMAVITLKIAAFAQRDSIASLKYNTGPVYGH
jgi:hypothetical protein